MKTLSGQAIFLGGAALICVPQALTVISAFLTGRPWFGGAVGAALFSNLAYCAWRGEKWAFYLLMFLCVLGVGVASMLLTGVANMFELIGGLGEILSVVMGACLLAFHPAARTFMDQQAERFRAER